jgi:hypothetical protein
MQTFLPYPSSSLTAKCLDSRRLGKQRVEALTILRVLEGKVDGWRNHPAVKMWKGYEVWLITYGIEICWEWKFRGFKDTVQSKLRQCFKKFSFVFELPPWLGDERVHASHRSNLLRKDSQHYSKFGWKEPDNLPYFWPVK